MLNFVLKVKKRNANIKRFLTIIILWVFGIAITPWGALHHHQVNDVPVEKTCTHSVHVKSNQDHCLICKAHFEKNYTIASLSYYTYLNSELMQRTAPVVSGSFVQFISTSLRGPPALS